MLGRPILAAGGPRVCAIDILKLKAKPDDVKCALWQKTGSAPLSSVHLGLLIQGRSHVLVATYSSIMMDNPMSSGHYWCIEDCFSNDLGSQELFCFSPSMANNALWFTEWEGSLYSSEIFPPDKIVFSILWGWGDLLPGHFFVSNTQNLPIIYRCECTEHTSRNFTKEECFIAWRCILLQLRGL